MSLKEIAFRIGDDVYHLEEHEGDGRKLPDLVRELVLNRVGLPYYVRHGRALAFDEILDEQAGPDNYHDIL